MMAYTARELIEYARSLADLQNTRFISYEDEITLINEAYRDVYNRYTESDGDYWDTEIIIDMATAPRDPNSQTGFLIPLPADFLKIRSLSYNNGGFWLPCNKFSLSNRDNNPSQPTYRLKNGNLWVIGCLGGYSQLKMNYYTVPEVVTAPDVQLELASDETVYTIPSITSHFYDAASNVFYYIKGLSIFAENVNAGVTDTIYTSAVAIDSVMYWAGYVYFRNAAASTIWRAPLATTLVPVLIAGPTGVAGFSIQNNTIYYTTGVETRSCTLTGTSDTLIAATAFPQYQLYGSHSLSIVASTLYLDGTTTAVPASQVRNDGVYFYLLSDNTVSRYKIDLGAPALVDTVDTDVVSIGSAISGTYLSMIGYQSAWGQSMVADTIFDYPANEVNEILAYTSAVAYSRKQNDAPKLATLAARLAELWDRFWSVNKRDEYQFTRINNDYQQTLNNW
jgi:hypothetical protein